MWVWGWEKARGGGSSIHRRQAGKAGGRGLREAPQPGRRRGRRPAFSSPRRAYEIFHSPPGPQPAPDGPHKAALCWEGGRAPGRPDTHAGRGGERASWHPNCLREGGPHPAPGHSYAGVNGAQTGERVSANRHRRA